MQGKIGKILVPVDFTASSWRALRFALRQAGVWKANLEILHVVGGLTAQMGQFPFLAPGNHSRISTAKAELKSFVELASRSLTQGAPDETDIELMIRSGRPVHTICREALNARADLVIIDIKEKQQIDNQTILSTVGGVVEQSESHVLVIPENAHLGPIERVVCAIDLLEDDAFNIWKTARILQPFSPELYCVHVHAAHNGKQHIPIADLESFYQQNAPSIPLRFFEISGYNAWNTLHEFAQEHLADMIVVYKPMRGLLDQLLHTSVSRKIVGHSQIPVLVIK